MSLISRTAAAKLLDCTPQTISNYAKQGLIDEVVRENAGRVTMFYDEDQLRALIPDLHALEDLKAKIKAESDQLQQDLDKLSAERDKARKEFIRINGGKKTYAHVRDLIVACYSYVQTTRPVAKGKYEVEVLSRLLRGETVEDIMEATRSTEYRVEKTVLEIARRMVTMPKLIEENKYLAKEVDRLAKENEVFKMTADYRVQPQKVTIKRVVSVEGTGRTKEVYELPSLEQMKSTPVDDLGISSYAKEGLKFNGIHTLYELLSYKERQLSDMRRIGLERASEINSYLVKLGLRLGMTGEEG